LDLCELTPQIEVVRLGFGFVDEFRNGPPYLFGNLDRRVIVGQRCGLAR
jgi:hypothetical protein